jgi:hypothetical protein
LFWLLPLFGHSIAAPPEAAPSFTTTKGENVLWLDRLSSSTTSTLLPELLLDEELLELELLDELELLEELLLDEELLELELLDELELLLDDELLEELELLLDEDELLLVPSPAQVGAAKLPSWLPWKPKPVLWPGESACQLQQFVN